MAKKKLNKKVVIVGLFVLAPIILGGIWYAWYKSLGPQKFIEDGNIALAAKDYETTIKQYGRAFARAKDNETRKKVLFKLSDVYIITDDWRKALGCWNKIATIDTSDTISRTKSLDFFYDMADSGQISAWKLVRDTSDELLKIAPESKFYLINGRAKLELAKRGEAADPIQAFDEAISVLNKAQELDPKNASVYRYLADATEARGDMLASKGTFAEKSKSQILAQKLLEKAIAFAPKDPNAYLQLLDVKLRIAREKLDKKQVEALESDFAALTKKFPANPDVFTGLAFYYTLNINDIDKAVTAAQKAMELSPQSAKYARNAAEIYYRKGTLAKDDKYIEKAIDTAKTALAFPDARDTESSRQYTNKMNKLALNTFLAFRLIEQLIALPANAPKQHKDPLIADAEQAFHEISQIYGTGEDPHVMAIDGMLTYAKGDTAEGIRKMYAAYEQLKQADIRYQDTQLMQLSYVLAMAFSNSAEIGATRDFLAGALLRGLHFTKPDMLLTYGQITLQFRPLPYFDIVGEKGAVTIYEKFIGSNTTSKLLRARANIAAGLVDDANMAMLAKVNSDDPNVIAVKISLLQTKISLLQTKINNISSAQEDANEAKKAIAPLQADIDKYLNERLKLAQKLLQSEPNATQAMAIICEDYIAKKKTPEAKAVVSTVLTHAPDNIVASFYKLLLAEPDPAKVTPQRRSELTLQAETAISDPLTRAAALADYYRSRNEPNKAIVEYKKMLEIEPANRNAISGIFDNALRAPNLTLAEQIAAVAKRENTDLCDGQVFMARLAIVKKDYNDALNLLEAVLKQRPIFSYAYVLRSNVQAALGKEQFAIEDARKAVDSNPTDGIATKNLASLLYLRNQKLGQKASAEQIAETRAALWRAMVMNEQEWQLQSIYAEYISDTDPISAVAIRQGLLRQIPNVQNATLLGNLFMKIANDEKNAVTKKGYLAQAESAYEQGYKMDPSFAFLLQSYAEFYNKTGKPELAAQLLNKASNKNLLWQYQLQKGQYTQAKETLEALYKANPKDIITLNGLLSVSQNLGDAQSVTKYSQELVSFENTPESQLRQIEAFLHVGLVEQAEKKLASFKEKYPNDDRVIILQALAAIRKGQLADALTYINKNLELKPNDAISWYLKGQIDLSRGSDANAIDDFTKAKSISPSAQFSVQIRTDLARAYLQAGRGNDAINELVLAIDAEPENVRLYTMLEETYLKLGKTNVLTQFYDDAMKKDPNNPLWYNRAAGFSLPSDDEIKTLGLKNPEIQKRLRRTSTLSKKALELTQKANPNMSKDDLLLQARLALDYYLEVMLINGEYDTLTTYAAQYVDSDLAVVAFAKLATAKVQVSDKSAAIDYYRKALDKSVSDPPVLLSVLGSMVKAIGRDEAMQWCTSQLKATPDSLPINLAMCNLMRMKQDNNNALVYIDKCLQLAPPKSQARRKFLDVKQAILLALYNTTSDDKYLNEAIKLYETFIAESSSVEVAALNNLAYMLVSNNRDIDKALAYSKKACDTTQNNPNFLDTYAYILYKKGDYAKASEVIQSAEQMFKKSSVSAPAEVYEHMGMINAKLGHKNEAINAYKQALKIGDQTLSDTAKQRIKTAIEGIK